MESSSPVASTGGPAKVDEDEETKKREAASRRRQERISMRQSRMSTTQPNSEATSPTSKSRSSPNRKSRRASRGLKSSGLRAGLTGPNAAALQIPEVAAEIGTSAKLGREPAQDPGQRNDLSVSLPGAYPQYNDNDGDDGDRFAETNEPEGFEVGDGPNSISTVKRPVSRNTRRTEPSPVLQSARIVTERERMKESMVLDESEKMKIEEAARKEAEENIKSKLAVAEVDHSEQKKRRRRLICYLIMFVLFLGVIGAIVGGIFASNNDNTSSSKTQLTFAPTNAPTPLVPFDETLDTCQGAQDLTEMMGQPILGSTRGSNVDRFDTCEIIERNGRGIWYRLVGDGRTKTASTCNNTFFDTQLSIYSGNCTQPRCVSGNDQIRCGNGDQSMVAWETVAGMEYYIHVHGQRSAEGVYELVVDDLNDNDECEGATQVIFGSDLPVFGSTRGKTLDNNIAIDCGVARQISAGVWYAVAGVDGPMVAFAETDGLTAFRPQLSVYEGSGCGDLACVAGSVSETAEWTGAAGKRYFVLVHGLSEQEGDFQFRVLSELIIVEPPQDDDGLLTCDMAGEVPVGSMGRGNTIFGPVSDGGSCGPEIISNAQGKWFTTTGTGGAMVASTCETTTGFDTQISVYRGDSCDSLECIDGNDQSSECGDGSEVLWHSLAGETYFILVQGTTGRTGEFNLTVDDETTLGEPILVTSPTCDDAVGLPVNRESVLGSFADAVPQTVGGCAADVVGGEPGVWYEVVGTGSPMTISACDSIGSTALRLLVFTGDCDALECVDAISTPCGPQESATWSSVESQQYFILAQRQSGVDDSGQSLVGVDVDGDGLFVLFAGETVIHNGCRTPIGPIQADNRPIFGALWTATIGMMPICDSTDDGPPGRGVWYSIIGNGQRMLAHTCSSLTSFDAQIRLFEGDCLDGPNLRCVDQIRRTCENGQQLTMWQSEVGVLYYLLVSGFSPVSLSNFALTVSMNNDICFGAEGPLLLDGTVTLGSTLMATIDDIESIPTCPMVIGDTQLLQPFESSPGVWYEVVGDGGVLTASTCSGAQFDTVVTVFGGGNCERLSCLDDALYEKCDGNDGNSDSGSMGMRVSWPSIDGNVYHVLVYGVGVGDFGISLSSSTLSS